tara:strand:- start:1060 stop:1269 length:210 start_codon:yes stop_codon:yes gene_type:complete
MYWSKEAHHDAIKAARCSSMMDNLVYLQANIGYFLGLDSGQRKDRLDEILGTLSVVKEQIESGRQEGYC